MAGGGGESCGEGVWDLFGFGDGEGGRDGGTVPVADGSAYGGLSIDQRFQVVSHTDRFRTQTQSHRYFGVSPVGTYSTRRVGLQFASASGLPHSFYKKIRDKTSQLC